MALYDITPVNGVTKIETEEGFRYEFLLEKVETNTAGNYLVRESRTDSKRELLAFADISNNLGAADIEGYVDALAKNGNYGGGGGNSINSDSRVDSFGRFRVSSPDSLIDLKQVNDGLPLFYDEQTGGTGSRSYAKADAASTLAVLASSDFAIAQTKQRFNYQTGKSQLIECTFANMQPEANVVKRIGYFSSNIVTPFDSDKDGLWLESSDGVAKFVVSKTGAASETQQSSWNIDKMDGTGPSGITLDLSKAQILVMDFQWLGVGRVRFGFSIDGAIYYCHEVLNANNATGVYMASPNQPIRYEVRSNGGAGSITQICATVQSEGGQNPLGVIRSISDALDMQCSSASTVYAVYGIRLKQGVSTDINLLDFSAFNENNDDFVYRILLNPTVTGTFTYAAQTNSAVEVATSDLTTPATASGGIEIGAGVNLAGQAVDKQLESALKLGTAIDGTRDEIVFCVEPITPGADIFASFSWRELI